MPRKVSVQEYNRLVRQHNQKVNQEIKRRVDTYNREVRNYNREVDRVNSANKRALETHNRDVRNFNSKQRQRYNQAVSFLRSTSQSTITTYRTSSIHRSTVILTDAYEKFENDRQSTVLYVPENRLYTDWPEKEASNSVELLNALNGNFDPEISSQFLQISHIENSLSGVSSDLANRWKGALFSLNHHNPDAARHFCTSTREILTAIIDFKAPDSQVLFTIPDCELYNGRPTRRSKLSYLIRKNSIDLSSFENFVEKDIDDVISLFESLNSGTHGNAGKLESGQLIKLKTRVEDSINFILQF